jgi:hypothetical protein
MAECKTCKWYGVQPDARGRIVVRALDAWPCKAPEPEQPLVPSSVLKAYGWKWPPPRIYMRGNDGTDCQTYAYRQKKEKQ